MKTLFDATSIGIIRLKNRLIRSATWEAMADPSGKPTPRLIQLYRELAEGGTGLIISSATTFTADSTHARGMLAIPDDCYVPAFRELTETVHAAGTPLVLQLAFPGRNGDFWAPADAPLDELRNIIRQFGNAAVRAQAAGFDGVQVHAAHGYFLSQFLNARRNLRKDEYGGAIENRIRFLLEIVQEIRHRAGEEYPVLVKINCSDFEEGDSVWEACRSVCRHLEAAGISAIEVSGGMNHMPFPPQGLPHEESVFSDYAEEIAQITSVPVILVGMNRSLALMTELLNRTGIEYLSLSRPFLRQPDLAAYWKENPGQSAECISCDACRNQPDGNICPFRESPPRGT